MPKPSLNHSEAVVVATPGQPSAALLEQLKIVGAKLTDDQIAKVVQDVETERSAFQSSAIVCGVFLLAKKQTLRHGQWLPWLEQFSQHAWQMRNALRISTEVKPRSLQGYTFLAQHFLADLEQGNFQPESRDEKVALPAVQPADVLTLDTLPNVKQAAVYGAIEQFVAGRSLRRMLMDFRRAECATEQEDADLATAKAKRAKPEKNHPDQMDFWDEMNIPLTQLSTLMSSPDFVERTTRESWLKLAAELTARAKDAKAMAEKMRA
jgi:hypothetical protein